MMNAEGPQNGNRSKFIIQYSTFDIRKDWAWLLPAEPDRGYPAFPGEGNFSRA